MGLQAYTKCRGIYNKCKTILDQHYPSQSVVRSERVKARALGIIKKKDQANRGGIENEIKVGSVDVIPKSSLFIHSARV